MRVESFMPSEQCRMVGKGLCPCPLEDVANALSKKWTLTIIVTIGNFDRLRFNNMLARIGKITPKTLADRLKKLKAMSIIQRKSYHEIPPRVEYSLTFKGRKLRQAIIPLMRWAAKQKG